MNSNSSTRIKLVVYFALILLSILLLRLYFLQVMSGKIYAEIASENITREKPILAPRGNIYDREGRLLVKSVPVSAVAVEPYTVIKDEETLQMLSQKLEMPLIDIKEKLEKTNVSYLDRIILKTNISPSAMVYLKENSDLLHGVEVINVYLREYQYGFLISHVLGYIGEISEEQLGQVEFADYEGGDQIGLTGIEKYYESILKGKKGKIVYEVDPLGKPVDVLEEVDFIAGNDLYLSVDIELQKVVEEALYQGILDTREKVIKNTDENYNVPGGAVVVLDAKNGEVLSMASYPTYDPQVFSGGINYKDWQYLNDPENYYPLNNRAVMAFPPGSVFKIITAYAGLCENIISENSRNVCNGIWYGLGNDFPKKCWSSGGHGSLDIRGAIKNSCDIFFYEVGLGLYLKSKNVDELLQKYSRLFGMGQATGIDLPFEDSGIVPDIKWKKEYFKDQVEYSVWYPGDTVNMAIGQGDLAVTPLQLAQAYSIFANRGINYTPHLVKEIRDSQGNLFMDDSDMEYSEVPLDEQYVNIMEEGFNQVMNPGGTAASSFIDFPLDEIPLAGKTGTAEFYGRQDFAWFASYGPIGDPKYVIAIMLEEGGSGGSNASPIAAKIYKYLFNTD